MTPQFTPRRTNASRRGSVVLEALISMTLLSLVLGLAAQTSTAMLRQRQLLATQQLQQNAKSNLMAYAMALPYPDVSTATLQEFAAQRIELRSGYSWQIVVSEQPSHVDDRQTTVKKIAIAVHKAAAGRPPTRPLVAWRYPVDSEREQEVRP